MEYVLLQMMLRRDRQEKSLTDFQTLLSLREKSEVKLCIKMAQANQCKGYFYTVYFWPTLRDEVR